MWLRVLALALAVTMRPLLGAATTSGGKRVLG
jgi:hypothetical protein